MSIDWFTFAAQIVNFLILVGLLRYFLYGPIVRAMQQRERKVTQRLTEAETAKSAAEQQRQDWLAKTESIEQQRGSMLAEAQADADSQRQLLLREARSEIETRQQQWTEAFKRDQQDLTDQTRREIERMGFDAARRTIAELADIELQRQLCDSFIRQLRTLEEERKTEIAEQLTGSDDPILVRSAMELDTTERDRLRRKIREAFDTDAELQFKTDDSLVYGLEVDAGGYSLKWNAAGVLGQMQAGLR